jgi:hypothetical protein
MKTNDWITAILVLTVLSVFVVYISNLGYKYFVG